MASVRSAKGETVDFDLLQIKATIASTPKPVEVANRESYVDNQFRRRSARRVAQRAADAGIDGFGGDDDDSSSVA